MSFKKFMANICAPRNIETRVADALGPVLWRQVSVYLSESSDAYDYGKGSISALVETAMEMAYHGGRRDGMDEIRAAWAKESAERRERMTRFLFSDEAKSMTEHDRQLRALQEFAGIDAPTFKD